MNIVYTILGAYYSLPLYDRIFSVFCVALVVFWVICLVTHPEADEHEEGDKNSQDLDCEPEGISLETASYKEDSNMATEIEKLYLRLSQLETSHKTHIQDSENRIVQYIFEMEKRIMSKQTDLAALETTNATLLLQLAAAVQTEGQTLLATGTRVLGDLTNLKNQLANGVVDPTVVQAAIDNFTAANAGIQASIDTINTHTTSVAALDTPGNDGTPVDNTPPADGSTDGSAEVAGSTPVADVKPSI